MTTQNDGGVFAEHSVTHSGVEVYFQISLCSNDASYGLQVKIATKQGAANVESEFLRDRAKGVSLDAARDLVESYLRENGTRALVAKVEAWKVRGAELRAQNAVWMAKQARARARRHAKLKAQGFTHCITAVIHKDCGDDYVVESFTQGAPTARQIAAVLRNSVVKTDYRVEVLS